MPKFPRWIIVFFVVFPLALFACSPESSSTSGGGWERAVENVDALGTASAATAEARTSAANGDKTSTPISPTATRKPTNTPRPTNTLAPVDTDTPAPTNTPRPTSTPRPPTPRPTSTPLPTATPRPANTATPLPPPTFTPAPPTSTQVPLPTVPPKAPDPVPTNCDPSYPTVCIPPPPPDLDCKDIPHRRFQVLPPDPHNFDGNSDGVGCES